MFDCQLNFGIKEKFKWFVLKMFLGLNFLWACVAVALIFSRVELMVCLFGCIRLLSIFRFVYFQSKIKWGKINCKTSPLIKNFWCESNKKGGQIKNIHIHRTHRHTEKYYNAQIIKLSCTHSIQPFLNCATYRTRGLTLTSRDKGNTKKNIAKRKYFICKKT